MMTARTGARVLKCAPAKAAKSLARNARGPTAQRVSQTLHVLQAVALEEQGSSRNALAKLVNVLRLRKPATSRLVNVSRYRKLAPGGSNFVKVCVFVPQAAAALRALRVDQTRYPGLRVLQTVQTVATTQSPTQATRRACAKQASN